MGAVLDKSGMRRECSQQAPNAACSEHMEFVVLDGSRSEQELKI